MLFNEQLLSIISQLTGIKEDDILSKSRNRKVCESKQLYAYFLRVKFQMKLKDIGKIMKCDHSSVMHNIKVVQNMIDINDESVMMYIESINTHIEHFNAFNLTRKIKLNIPIEIDIEVVKTALNELKIPYEYIYE